ncbi:hypothetical protein DD598_28310 [Enterobacter cloacae complex sp. 2DZ2F16B1]|nr:hypothetical protein DD598_28310 [Enterobacter cloacae complex sp. 2DZ2F16B1]
MTTYFMKIDLHIIFNKSFIIRYFHHCSYNDMIRMKNKNAFYAIRFYDPFIISNPTGQRVF